LIASTIVFPSVSSKRSLITDHKDMVVDPYLPALHSEEERVANLAFKVYFVADTEFLIRTFLPPADQSYRYRLIDVVFEFLAQLLKVISGGTEGVHRTVEPSSIPFAWAHLKLAGLALWPIAKAIVPVQNAPLR